MIEILSRPAEMEASSPDIRYRKYEVDAQTCLLETGDRVTPETIIGFYPKTNLPVRAEFEGQVATVYFNPMHDSLMITAVPRIS
jgi:hypothetical protein